jgi:hypothetical protein
MLHLSRLDTRGVSRSSRNVRRDVVDVEGADRRAALFADGEVVWSWRPKVLALSPSEAEKLRGGDGGKRDGSPRRVRISRNTTAQGRPECFRLYLWSRALRAIFLARGPRVQRSPGLPCALCLYRGWSRAKLGCGMRRENAKSWLRPCCGPSFETALTRLLRMRSYPHGEEHREAMRLEP